MQDFDGQIDLASVKRTRIVVTCATNYLVNLVQNLPGADGINKFLRWKGMLR